MVPTHITQLKTWRGRKSSSRSLIIIAQRHVKPLSLLQIGMFWWAIALTSLLPTYQITSNLPAKQVALLGQFGLILTINPGWPRILKTIKKLYQAESLDDNSEQCKIIRCRINNLIKETKLHYESRTLDKMSENMKQPGKVLKLCLTWIY